MSRPGIELAPLHRLARTSSGTFPCQFIGRSSSLCRDGEGAPTLSLMLSVALPYRCGRSRVGGQKITRRRGIPRTTKGQGRFPALDPETAQDQLD